MDRSKWEYKKLGDLCSKLTDGSHNPPKGIENSDYRMISSQNIFNDKIVLNDYRYLSKEDFETEDKRTALKKGDLLLTIVGAIGRCYVLNGTEGNLTLQRSVAALTPKDTISSRFLMYYFIGNNANLLEEAHGAAQKGIYLRQLSNLIVPVPTLDDQQRIVAELDCLNEMIALKQEQLKEFDKLAQSIFYDMFGDPITNEKGWKMSLLKDATTNITDGDHMPPPKSERGVPFVTISNVNKETHQIDFSDTFFVPKEYYDAIPDSKKPQGGDVLYTVTGSYGIPILLKEKKEFCFQRHIGLIRPGSEIEPVFLCIWAECKPVKEYADRVATGVAQKTVSLKALRSFPIILPPLTLQQHIAEKIQAIESQKELVKKSIAETQHLLDYTMDKYFG